MIMTSLTSGVSRSQTHNPLGRKVLAPLSSGQIQNLQFRRVSFCNLVVRSVGSRTWSISQFLQAPFHQNVEYSMCCSLVFVGSSLGLSEIRIPVGRRCFVDSRMLRFLVNVVWVSWCSEWLLWSLTASFYYFRWCWGQLQLALYFRQSGCNDLNECHHSWILCSFGWFGLRLG